MIAIKDGVIFYYGSPAGFVEEDGEKAQADVLFQKDDLASFLNSAAPERRIHDF